MRNLLLNFFMVAIFVFMPSKVSAATDTGAKGWPRMFENGGNKVVVHQPRRDAWDNYTTLTGKSAVVVQLKGEKKNITVPFTYRQTPRLISKREPYF